VTNRHHQIRKKANFDFYFSFFVLFETKKTFSTERNPTTSINNVKASFISRRVVRLLRIENAFENKKVLKQTNC